MELRFVWTLEVEYLRYFYFQLRSLGGFPFSAECRELFHRNSAPTYHPHQTKWLENWQFKAITKCQSHDIFRSIEIRSVQKFLMQTLAGQLSFLLVWPGLYSANNCMIFCNTCATCLSPKIQSLETLSGLCIPSQWAPYISGARIRVQKLKPICVNRVDKNNRKGLELMFYSTSISSILARSVPKFRISTSI